MYASLGWNTLDSLWISISLFIPQVQPRELVIRQGLLPLCPEHSPERLGSPSATLFGPHPPGSCSGCGPLPLPLLAGLVAADAVVSLLIVVVVFICVRPRDRPTQGEGRARTEGGVPREEVPTEGSPGGSPGGNPWGPCWGNS